MLCLKSQQYISNDNELSKMERINPRVDIAFKKIFGIEENKDLLISLINSIVSEEDQVVDITLLNPYNPKNFAQDVSKELEDIVARVKNSLDVWVAFLTRNDLFNRENLL